MATPRRTTIDHEGPPLAPNPRTRAALAVRIVAGAPQRLLLVFLWFCYVAAATAVSGFFHPLVVVPATAALVAVTWWLFPREDRADPRSAIGSVLGLGVACTWFLLNRPYVAQRVDVTRDPDIYTLAALWLRRHGSTDVPVPAVQDGGTPGFSFQNGVLEPQGNHLVSAISAAGGWLFGQDAVFWGNLACGAAALLAVYVLGRRLTGPFWGLVPTVGLAVSLPMVAFSRALYSEPLALTLTGLGAALLLRAWQDDRRSGYLLAGAAFGGVALTRIDGVLPLIGALGGLAVAALADPDRERNGRRWAAPLVLLGSLPGVALGFLDLYLHSGVYVVKLNQQLTMLAELFFGVAVLALALAFVRLRADRHSRLRRLVRHLAVAGGVVVAVGLVVLATRPWWYVSHGPAANGIVMAAQQADGQAVDGTRMYAEDSVTWLSWYYGWPAVVAGSAGLIAWLVVGARTRATHLLWLTALFLPSAALYLTQPTITPDQIWAMRRFLPVVIPGLLLAATWLTREVATRGLFRRIVPGRGIAALLVCCAVAWPVVALGPMWTAQDKAGALAGNEQVCARIDGRPTIVAGRDSYQPTVFALCGVRTVGVQEPTQALIARARKALGGGSVALATRIAPQKLPWVDGKVPDALVYTQSLWESSVSGPPDAQVSQTRGIVVGLVLPDGSLVPLN